MHNRYYFYLATLKPVSPDLNEHFSCVESVDELSADIQQEMKGLPIGKTLEVYIYKKDDADQRVVLALKKRPETRTHFNRLIAALDVGAINDMSGNGFHILSRNKKQPELNIILKMNLITNLREDLLASCLSDVDEVPDDKEESVSIASPTELSSNTSSTYTSFDASPLPTPSPNPSPMPDNVTEEEVSELRRFIAKSGY